MGGGLFDFRVTPNPIFMLDVNLDVEFDNIGVRFLWYLQENTYRKDSL